MAIEKNSVKVLREECELSSRSRESMSSEDDDDEPMRRRNSTVESDDDDDDDDLVDDYDSGAGSDDFDLLELGEAGEEFCQVGDQTCRFPAELYDLSGLEDILSVDVWNETLTEEDRFNLTKYLPDMDNETYMQTMKELFSGLNFHFGSPVDKLFKMLKGGLCEPRVALYRQGFSFFQRRIHYHHLRNYHNQMVSNLHQIRETWVNCKGYSIQEKLHLLTITKNQKSLFLENKGKLEFDSNEGYGSQEALWRSSSKKVKNFKGTPPIAIGKRNSSKKDLSASSSSHSAFARQNSKAVVGYGSGLALDDDEYTNGSLMGFPVHLNNNMHFLGGGGKRTVNQLSDIKVLTAKPYEFGKKVKYTEDDHHFLPKDQMKYGKRTGLNELSDVVAAAPIWLHKKNEDISSGSIPRRKKFTYEQQPSSVRRRDSTGVRRGNRMLERNEETESDSSEQIYEDDNPLMSKVAYPSSLKSGAKKTKLVTRDKNENAAAAQVHVGPSPSRKMTNLDKQRRKMHEENYSGLVEDKYIMSSRRVNNYNDEPEKEVELYKEKQHRQFDAFPTDRRRTDYSSPRSSHNHEYDTDDDETNHFAENNGLAHKKSKKGQAIETFQDDHHESGNMPLSVSKKRKVREDISYGQDEETPVSSKKQGKRKINDFEMNTPEAVTPILETEPVLVIPEMEPKPQKKPFIIITPTVHTGFSISIIHLLSAVRTAMTNPISEDLVDNIDKVENSPPTNIPSLAIQEIVNRVKSNPGDPSILEAPEPLQDLVRGVLRIFSSRTAPLGAKGWKPLVMYEKSSRTWSWIGPLAYNSSDPDAIEEVTSPEAWSLPRKMLVKLVDAFANWLKSGQETFQQMGTLPAPPLAMMQANLDEKERFRDLRAQKSLTTISPSAEEIRDYFRKEEFLRYSIPDRAFSYTAIDGRKSVVAPLRRCGGKPTSKARDHFMLKRDRPPHVTILCLVRDAASRLPGSIGTRADVCTLIRDSQYTVEDVSDAQVNQVVSGALDRLHYERDPCVLFDSDRKLWVYLHRDREEEDFEDDGTSSTKKWKRPKKDSALDDTFEQEMITAGGEELEGGGLDVISDPNNDNGEQFDIAENNSHEATGLNSYGFDSTQGSGELLLCQENPANGDFDDKNIWQKTAD
ncbi:uncharacterized protein LOC124911196 [Impatiens glandulifera]|uniref:uncharacterized protein LOC124911196 n=1 Tax=Impatiens glandulifera TaxID=253017 RepID=UPI001FB06C72|nr:uncharacterized protein LOC124911196 [Impatiens glandulifera]